MAIVQGIVAPDGTVVRSRGNFKVAAKGNNLLRIQVTNQKTAKAFVLATPWRGDGDIGVNAGVSASPDPTSPSMMIFAVDDYYGLSFRIEP